jgi:hypothetical protein
MGRATGGTLPARSGERPRVLRPFDARILGKPLHQIHAFTIFLIFHRAYLSDRLTTESE